jgi:hypothetical protein
MGGKPDFSGMARMPTRRSGGVQLPGYMLDEAQKARRRLPSIRAERMHDLNALPGRLVERPAPRGWESMVLLMKQAYARLHAGGQRPASDSANGSGAPSDPVRRGVFPHTRSVTGVWKNPEWTRSNLG